MSAEERHPLDLAIALDAQGEGIYQGHTDPEYHGMVGPFGGLTAAVMMNAVQQHPARQGDPVAITVNFCGAVADGPFEVRAQPVRTNRSTQHWSVQLSQGDVVATTASVITAVRRPTWSATEARRPEAPAFDDVPAPAMVRPLAWLNRFDIRVVRGNFMDPAHFAQATPDATSVHWIRDQPPRPLDFQSVTAMCDAFLPRIFLRRPKQVPIGSVTFSVYFHADAALLAEQGSRPMLGVARAAHFGLGYSDQSGEIWSEDGVMLATTHQLVYFRE